MFSSHLYSREIHIGSNVKMVGDVITGFSEPYVNLQDPTNVNVQITGSSVKITNAESQAIVQTSASTAQSKFYSVAIIVGPTIGLLVIFLACFIIFWVRRSKRNFIPTGA
ncbi:hypothetical protein DSO57_1008128 [Entomophthora muscae]|uniref:Uncharacterized protein n=1 Tax=Entomophthora muscae TaxID=34485 RepID=A0ACC2SJW2_9FUNG|nr:hypothetical protein DSO57_1008128 [Entomophthora muscae]